MMQILHILELNKIPIGYFFMRRKMDNFIEYLSGIENQEHANKLKEVLEFILNDNDVNEKTTQFIFFISYKPISCK